MKKTSVMVLAVACAMPATAAQPEGPADKPAADKPAAEMPVVPVPAPITFFDSRLFDSKLANDLADGKGEVSVEVAGKISLNNIPARIDKWLTVVGEHGEVVVKSEPPALKPKFLLAVLPVVFSFAQKFNSERLWEPAKQYNAVMVYHVDRDGESVLDRIVFTKKKK